MMWQDITITIANIIFAYALIPQVMQGFKHKKGYINLQTAFLTTIGLYAMAIAFVSLNLIFSTIIVGINATLWFILLIQGLIYK